MPALYCEMSNVGAFSKVDLTLEANPIISLYKGGKPGRLSPKQANDHRHHGSLVFIAHKIARYVCHSGGSHAGRSTRSASVRTSEKSDDLTNVGIILSKQHPPASTFLAPAVAEYCLARWVFGNCSQVAVFTLAVD